MDGQTTLVGIVSGGLGCGNGIPNWYTRVSFYEEWIACIQEKSRELKTFVQVSLESNLAQKKNEKIEKKLLIAKDNTQTKGGSCLQELGEATATLLRADGTGRTLWGRAGPWYLSEVGTRYWTIMMVTILLSYIALIKRKLMRIKKKVNTYI